MESCFNSPKELVVIGNGFDLAHDVKSSYGDFKEFLRQKDHGLLNRVEAFLDHGKLWGDFEEALATLSREDMIEGLDDVLDETMETFDEDDPNFSYANYYLSLERAQEPLYDLNEGLRKRFRQWVNSLTLPRGRREEIAALLPADAVYLSFNYTEFAETLYGIPRERILYLHGDRRMRDRELILGHGQNPDENFDKWWEENRQKPRFRPTRKGRRGRVVPNDSLAHLTYFNEDDSNQNWRNPIRFYAAEATASAIESYFEDSAKHTGEILSANAAFFDSLGSLQRVTIIGHSLARVDFPYFLRMLQANANPESMLWRISYHDKADRGKPLKFGLRLGLRPEQLEPFPL